MSSKENKYINPNKLLELKKVPESLIRLREMLQLPAFHNIATKANKEGRTFEECLGYIAADLNILLDGDYDVEQLCDMLCTALDASTKAGRDAVDSPQLLDKRLVAAKIEEREQSLNIEFAKLPTAKTASAQSVSLHNIFMLEHGCKVCMDRNECIAAKRCMGKENGTGEQEMVH